MPPGGRSAILAHMALGLLEVVRRLGHHRPSAASIAVIEENRHRAIELMLYYDETLPEGFEKDQALQTLEAAHHWANAAVVTRRDPTDIVLPDEMPPG